MGEGEAGYADTTLGTFLDLLASAQPVPGGGSASAVAASLAASLVVMVARLSMDRPKYAAYAATHERAVALGEAARHRCLALAGEDAAAYATMAAALRLPRETEEQRLAREEELHAAARLAANVPLELVRECRQLVEQIESLAGRSNLNASSDLDVAALLAQAAARGAGANVIVNLPMVDDSRYSGTTLSELEMLLHAIESVAAAIHAQVGSGGLRTAEPG